MIDTQNIHITKVKESKISRYNLENIPFGRTFTDHMLEATYENGEWRQPKIKPYQPIQFDPSLAALHYGQAIFEGVKAYKTTDGEARIFRPEENFKRFNISAKRMEMPDVPESIFMEGMRQLVKLDEKWIPTLPDHALYIRPFMFATDEAIGVRPSSAYKFFIILSPTGPYFPKPMRIYVEEKYVRAVPGGTGFAKAAGNYGAAMFPTEEAKRKGYDQVLWMDPFEHKYVQECGTMNVFFVKGNKVITPGLENGTILSGVTRMSVIKLLKESMGMEVEERNISIDEIVASFKTGELTEAFGTGTAVTILMIQELCYRDHILDFNLREWKVAPKIKEIMDGIKEGSVADEFHWMETV